MRTRHLNGLLVVAILLISTAPLYAQRQQQDVAKLKADARNLVGIIGSDKTKTQTYCQIEDLIEQTIQALQKKDRKKANALAEKIAELYKKMGPDFAALMDIKKRVGLNSPDGQEIASIVASLGESCGGQRGIGGETRDEHHHRVLGE
jgi:DNA repair exonuclease SbcCD ATPase subunit